MRICLYTESALPMLGGQEHVVDALAREFLALGHEPIVLAPPPRRPLRVDDSQVPYPVVRHPRFVTMRRLLGWYRWWLTSLHRRHRFDIIHCHSLYPTGYLAAVCRDRLDVPLVITSHGGDVDHANPRFAKPPLYQRHVQALGAADALIAISRFTETGFRRMHPATGPIVRIPNGVDLSHYMEVVSRPSELDPAIQPGRYFLFLGRLDVRKGVDVLLSALAKLPRAGRVELVVAGIGKERSQLESQAARLGIADRVRFVGAVAGQLKTYLLQNCVCTVAPSRWWEAFPLVVLESFAAGRPVIGAQIPGLSGLIEPRQTGWLVPPDSPDELAYTLASALKYRRETEAMGARAWRIAQDFSWQNVARRHLRLFRALVDQRAAARQDGLSGRSRNPAAQLRLEGVTAARPHFGLVGSADVASPASGFDAKGHAGISLCSQRILSF